MCPIRELSGSIDAYIVGEPFAAQSQMDGYGRVLYLTSGIPSLLDPGGTFEPVRQLVARRPWLRG